MLKAFEATPLNGADIIVINPGTTAPYSGMLPGFVAGHYTRAQLNIDLVRLTAAAGAELIDARAVAMDARARTIQLENGSELAFDLLSFDVGITSRMDQLPGFAQHGVPAKPLAKFASHWDAYRERVGTKDIVIIGGGIAGAELAMAMSFALRGQTASVRLLDRGSILSANSAAAQKHVRVALRRNNVEILENVSVETVTETGVVLGDGATLSANLVIGAAGASPHPWVEDTQLDLHQGFIIVDDTLQSSEAGVFAVGDCAHMAFDPRPKAGVYAVRQAPVLTQNLRLACANRPLLSYKPQSDYLKLVSLGSKRAFGEKFGTALSAGIVWRLKDRIDCAFMDQFG